MLDARRNDDDKKSLPDRLALLRHRQKLSGLLLDWLLHKGRTFCLASASCVCLVIDRTRRFMLSWIKATLLRKPMIIQERLRMHILDIVGK